MFSKNPWSKVKPFSEIGSFSVFFTMISSLDSFYRPAFNKPKYVLKGGKNNPWSWVLFFNITCWYTSTGPVFGPVQYWYITDCDVNTGHPNIIRFLQTQSAPRFHTGRQNKIKQNKQIDADLELNCYERNVSNLSFYFQLLESLCKP